MNIKEVIDQQSEINISFKDGSSLVGRKLKDRYEAAWFESLTDKNPKDIIPLHLKVIFHDGSMEQALQRAIDARFDNLPNKRIG